MKQEFMNGIKVDLSIVPLEYKNRTAPELIIGKSYFVSFGENIAHPCQLVEINSVHGRIEIKVEIRLKSTSKIHTSILSLFSDEIGTTKEQAVMHEVFY